jgi:hypothetical protein
VRYEHEDAAARAGCSVQVAQLFPTTRYCQLTTLPKEGPFRGQKEEARRAADAPHEATQRGTWPRAQGPPRLAIQEAES